jgi:hypothetical protein
MVEISLSGSGEGPGWATAPGYSTAGSLSENDIWQLPPESESQRLGKEEVGGAVERRVANGEARGSRRHGAAVRHARFGASVAVVG